jgi:hypothetical protein
VEERSVGILLVVGEGEAGRSGGGNGVGEGWRRFGVEELE